MTTFAKLILKLLTEYKIIIKKLMRQEEWTTKVRTLGLKRKALRHDDEVALFYKAERVLDEISRSLTQNTSAYWHSGLDEFYQYFKNILSEYEIIDNKVVHTARQASRYLVEAYQLIRLDAKRNKVSSRRLDHCGKIIAQYGSREQQEMFIKALKVSQHEDINFFLPVLDSFEKSLQRPIIIEEETPA